MMSSMFALALLSGAQAEGQAPPQAQQMPAMPQPPVQMSQLIEVLPAGTYRCEGRAMMSGHKPYPVNATAKIERDLNGFWQVIEYEERRTQQNQHPYASREHITFDRNAGRFVNVSVDNMGETMTLTAPSVEGNKVTFKGESMMGGQKAPLQLTFQKAGPRELQVRVQGEMREQQQQQRQGQGAEQKRAGAGGEFSTELSCRR